MKKAPDKKGLENSTLLNPSSILFSTWWTSSIFCKRALFKQIYTCLCRKEKENKEKNGREILRALQGAPPLPEGKKGGHDRKGGIFQSEVQLPVFWPGLFLKSVDRRPLVLCVLLIVSPLTTTASYFPNEHGKCSCWIRRKISAMLVCG